MDTQIARHHVREAMVCYTVKRWAEDRRIGVVEYIVELRSNGVTKCQEMLIRRPIEALLYGPRTQFIFVQPIHCLIVWRPPDLDMYCFRKHVIRLVVPSGCYSWCNAQRRYGQGSCDIDPRRKEKDAVMLE
jgi:hypothetical protein